jgi:hypothetical protein
VHWPIYVEAHQPHNHTGSLASKYIQPYIHIYNSVLRTSRSLPRTNPSARNTVPCAHLPRCVQHINHAHSVFITILCTLTRMHATPKNRRQKLTNLYIHYIYTWYQSAHQHMYNYKGIQIRDITIIL